MAPIQVKDFLVFYTRLHVYFYTHLQVEMSSSFIVNLLHQDTLEQMRLITARYIHNITHNVFIHKNIDEVMYIIYGWIHHYETVNFDIPEYEKTNFNNYMSDHLKERIHLFDQSLLIDAGLYNPRN